MSDLTSKFGNNKKNHQTNIMFKSLKDNLKISKKFYQ